MRMATFNILHGRSVYDGAVELGRLSASIREIDADVLALQEVDRDQPRSAMADLTALAAEAMGAVTHRFVAAISGTPGARWMAATGREKPGTAAYGIALLSRFPVQSWQVLRLPRILVHEEPRAAMVGQLDTPMGPMTVANTHLSFVSGLNRLQLRYLVRDLRGLPGPRVLMGDLNMRPSKAMRWYGLRSLGAVATFPSDEPRRQLDHILTDDPTLRADACHNPVLTISDHRALVVDVSRP